MPEVEHSVQVAASRDEIWRFVQEMDHWAPYVAGYQRHEKLSADESLWFLKGELGGLSRVAEFGVRVTEWAGPERVSFALEGVNEPVTGSGIFLLTAIGGGDPAPVPARSPLDRAWAWLIRRVFVLLFPRRAGGSQAPHPAVGPADSQITFRLSLQGGGRSGPLLMLLVAPMLKPVAEDLANRIAARVMELARGQNASSAS